MIDNLIYASYSYNREIFPKTSPERWGLIFEHVAEMEARFQSEQSLKAALANFPDVNTLQSYYEGCD